MSPAPGHSGHVLPCNASLTQGEISHVLHPDRTLVVPASTPRQLEVPTLEVVRGALAASWLLRHELAGELHRRAELRIAPDRNPFGLGSPARGHSVIAFASSPSIFDDDALFVLEAASNPVEIR